MSTANGSGRAAGGSAGSGGRHIGEMLEDTVLAVKGFVEVLGAIGWCLVLLVVDYAGYFFPKRKNFRGETILITGACPKGWGGMEGRAGCGRSRRRLPFLQPDLTPGGGRRVPCICPGRFISTRPHTDAILHSPDIQAARAGLGG